jgi:hypothetical protein
MRVEERGIAVSFFHSFELCSLLPVRSSLFELHGKPVIASLL